MAQPGPAWPSHRTRRGHECRIIDGLIDTAFSREHFAHRVAAAGPNGILDPDHIAQAYWWLHQQPRDAWAFEPGLRLSVEAW